MAVVISVLEVNIFRSEEFIYNRKGGEPMSGACLPGFIAPIIYG